MSIMKADALAKAGLIRTRTYVVYRSAIDGKFVSKAYAEAHPDTTIRHNTVKRAAS